MLKNILNFWKNRHERFYKRKRWHLFLDIFLITLILALAVVVFRLFFYSPALINMITVPQIPINGEVVPEKKEIKFDFEAEPLASSVDLGEKIVWDIKYKNIGEITINQVELSFDLKSNNFDLIGFEVEGDLESKKDAFIFKNIAPGETKEARLSINYRQSSSDSNRQIEAFLKTKNVTDKLILEKTVDLPKVKINSRLSLEANLYYHSPQGDQLGIGPVPPVVGIPTKYWLIINADNQGDSISNLIFSAQLAPGVELAEEYSLLAGKFSYDKERRRLLWQVSSLDDSSDKYIANFALNFIPRANQVGENALILSDLEYYADDDWTGVDIYKKLYNLDTSLPADRLNKGEGKVLSE